MVPWKLLNFVSRLCRLGFSTVQPGIYALKTTGKRWQLRGNSQARSALVGSTHSQCTEAILLGKQRGLVPGIWILLWQERRQDEVSAAELFAVNHLCADKSLECATGSDFH